MLAMLRLAAIVIAAIAAMLMLPASPVLAGDGTGTAWVGSNRVSASYGSTEVDDQTSLINYVSVTAAVMPFRVWSSVCVDVHIVSQGTLVYQTRETASLSPSDYSEPFCHQFAPGIGAADATWEVYRPSNPESRPRVRRGESEIRVGFKYAEWAGIDVQPSDDPDLPGPQPTIPQTMDSATVTLRIPASSRPGGTWINPTRDLALTLQPGDSQTLHIRARAYTNEGNGAAGITRVDFTIQPAGSDNWMTLCSPTHPAQGDTFACDWHYSAQNSGTSILSFDVYDRDNNVNYAPQGERRVTIQVQAPPGSG